VLSKALITRIGIKAVCFVRFNVRVHDRFQTVRKSTVFEACEIVCTLPKLKAAKHAKIGVDWLGVC
jgi:hypothetical protein